MAIYGIDYYGLARYGGTPAVAGLSVSPLVVTTSGYGALTLTWSDPEGTYTHVRIVRSTSGFPTREDDGDTVFITTSGEGYKQYYDSGLEPGRFYYYRAFVGIDPPTYSSTTTYLINEYVKYSGSTYKAIANQLLNITPGSDPQKWQLVDDLTIWIQDEGVVGLPVKDHGHADYLNSLVPSPYKTTPSNLVDEVTTSNAALTNYLGIFSYAMDILRTEVDRLFYLRDITNTEAGNVGLLALDIGDGTFDTLPYPLRRKRLSNAVNNFLQRGSLRGLRDAINSITGWDVEFKQGDNLLLTSDSVYFDRPAYGVWRNDVNYPAKQIVSYAGNLYYCISGAMGSGQAPSGSATSNSYWSYINESQSRLYAGVWSATKTYGRGTVVSYGNYFYYAAANAVTVTAPTGAASSNGSWTYLSSVPYNLPPVNPETGGYSGWESNRSGQSQDNGSLRVVAGTAGALGFDGTGNMLLVLNDTGSANTLRVSSVPRTIGDTSQVPRRGDVAGYGVPLEGQSEWGMTVSYKKKDVVSLGPYRYVALKDNVASSPTGTASSNASWAYLGLNTITTYLASAYTKATTTGVTSKSVLTYYAPDGTIMAYIDALCNQQWDPFETAFPERLSVTNKALTSNVATLTTATNHNLFVGQTVVVDQVDATFNGTYVITVVGSSTTFSYAKTAGNVTSQAATGSVTTIYRVLNGQSMLAGTNPWVTNSPWVTGQNVAFVDPSATGLPTNRVAYHASSSADGGVALTFRSAATNGYEHGVLFRYFDASNFWYASRTKLVKVVSGTATSMATWAALTDGDRILVTFSGSTITVYKYNEYENWGVSGVKTQLAQITDAAHSTRTNHGIIERATTP